MRASTSYLPGHTQDSYSIVYATMRQAEKREVAIMAKAANERVISNYERYLDAAFNRADYYPLGAMPDPTLYRPVGAWLGRLILPEPAERELVLGAWLELHLTPPEHQNLVGQRVRLRWATTLDLNARMWGATRSVHFDENALEAMTKGTVLGERLDGREYVNPLESLAGAHSEDDICVRLEGDLRLDEQPADDGEPIIFITRDPVLITGRYYALISFVGPTGEGDRYRVRHYERASGSFSGPEELVRLPEVVPDSNATRNSTAAGIERSPLNAMGWYAYGALDKDGHFVVQALAPRALLRLEPQIFCDRTVECMDYLKPKNWKKDAVKGQVSVALLCGDGITPHTAREAWREGERGLVIHLFGGIGGAKAEPAAKTPLYWGHFAFGDATVIREPLADELSFDILYLQVYAHNVDGFPSATAHYSRYVGDRQFGWLGSRPIQDLIFRLDSFTGDFDLHGRQVSALEQFIKQVEVMMARYRIADGRGATVVGAANNCAQDSAQALYASISRVGRTLRGRGGVTEALASTPENARRLEDLQKIGSDLRGVLVPWGSARADWEYEMPLLGGADDGGMLRGLGKVVSSWRTMLPPVAARAMAEVFFKHGASAWVLRSYQVGGEDPEIEPYVPNV